MDHKYAYFMTVTEYTGEDGNKYYCASVKRLEAWADNAVERIIDVSTGNIIQMFLARSKREAEDAAAIRNEGYNRMGKMAWATTDLHHPKHMKARKDYREVL